jgi:hypothetical protein
MTHEILKSAIALSGIKDFDATVNNYAAELQLWHEREAAIAKQGKLPPRPEWSDMIGEENPAATFTLKSKEWQAKRLAHIHPVKKPIDHPDVVAAVNDAGEVDYTIVDDDPTDDEVLRAKKDALLQQASVNEQAAINLALPPFGKRRMLQMRESDIQSADAKVAKSLHDANANASPAVDVAAEVAKRRTPDDTAFLNDRAAARAKVDAIQRKSAQVMSDVEDLTIANIGAYQIPAFG